MIIERIYKTDDGHKFKTEKEALDHEAKVKEERRKKAEADSKITKLEEEFNKKLDKAVEAYNEYSKAFNAYIEAYEERHGKKPAFFDDVFNDFINLFLN